jgi:hypothetical protein
VQGIVGHPAGQVERVGTDLTVVVPQDVGKVQKIVGHPAGQVERGALT